MEASFLGVQIAELFLVGEESLELDHGRACRRIVVVKVFCKLNAALGVDGGFERGDALETPCGIGDRLNQLSLYGADGSEIFRVLAEVLFVGGGVFGCEQDGAAGETGFDGV